MEPINKLTSTAVPLPLPNIDTDQIIPKQFLKRIERTGYGDFLFYDWRRIQEGPDAGKPDPSFVLNNPAYKGSQILIAEKNFGCGSSREHAAWALNQYGFLAVIAPSFADIFFSNAGKNGIILVRLSEEDVATLLAALHREPAAQDHHQPRSADRHRRPGLLRPLRHRPVPQVLPAERPRRHRPHPAPRSRTRRIRVRPQQGILVFTKVGNDNCLTTDQRGLSGSRRIKLNRLFQSLALPLIRVRSVFDPRLSLSLFLKEE